MLENAYSRPKNRRFGGLYPQNGEQYEWNPERHILGRKHVVWRIDRQNWSTCAGSARSFQLSFKLIRLSIAELQRCWCGYVTWPCDLDLWPFNLGQWTNMEGHVGNPSTKFQDPTPIRSWLMSYDVRRMPPLTMRLEPLRMRRITWPVSRGQIFPKYLKSLTPICLFTMQSPWLYDQDKLSYHK